MARETYNDKYQGLTTVPRDDGSATPDHEFFIFEWNEWLVKHLDLDARDFYELRRNLSNNVRTISILGMKGQAYVKTVGDKSYFIFKGYVYSRPSDYQFSRILVENAKVNFIIVGSKAFESAAMDSTKFGIFSGLFRLMSPERYWAI